MKNDFIYPYFKEVVPNNLNIEAILVSDQIQIYRDYVLVN